jgi:hypothetical protein
MNLPVPQQLGHLIDGLYQTYGLTPHAISSGVERFILRGVPGLFGVDPENWISMGQYPVTTMDDILGVVYSVPKDVISGISQLKEGDLRGLEKLMPSGVRSVVVAHRWAKEGIRDLDGNLLYSPSNYQIILKALSIPPLGPSETYQMYESKTAYMKYIRHKQQPLLRNLRKAINAGDYDQIQLAKNAIYTYNQQVPKAERINLKQSMSYAYQNKGRMFFCMSKAREKEMELRRKKYHMMFTGEEENEDTTGNAEW